MGSNPLRNLDSVQSDCVHLPYPGNLERTELLDCRSDHRPFPVVPETASKKACSGSHPRGSQITRFSQVLGTRTEDAMQHDAESSGSLISPTSGEALPSANEPNGLSSNLATCVALTNRAIKLERPLLQDLRRSGDGSRAAELTPKF